MIPEAQQEQAALYALGLLDADGAAGFERLLEAEPGLRDFTRDCQEAAATLALAPALSSPPAELKQRIMRQLESGVGAEDNIPQMLPSGQARGARRSYGFAAVALPWAIAALLMVFCGLLITREGPLENENTSLKGTLAMMRHARPINPPVPATAPDLLAAVAFCQLEPTAAGGPSDQPRATVAWDANRQEGVLQIVQLTPPASGKDYQLWAVEEGRQDAVSAGLVHVDSQGRARIVFKPEAAAGNNGRVLAFALSLEQAGGSPTNAGPILLLGKL